MKVIQRICSVMTEINTPKAQWISDILIKTIKMFLKECFWTEVCAPKIYLLQS